MKLTTPILAAAGIAAIAAAAFAAGHAQAPAPIVERQVASTLVTSLPTGVRTVTVVGTGSVQGTPDQATMSFGVGVTAGSAAAALSGEAGQAQRLLNALKGDGIAEKDIQTQWVSLYPDTQHGTFVASSSVSAIIRSLSHAGSIIDAGVRAAGDSIRLQGISLSIGDTSSLMASARASAVHDAGARAGEYAQAAGMKLGQVVSISESGNAPQPVYYGGAAAPSATQPIEPGQQTLQVTVTVVYQLN
jgi:hypothetical protein